MIRKSLHLLILLCISCMVAAQDPRTLKQQFVDAEYFFINEDYEQALDLYQTINNETPDNYNVIYRIGLCYLHIPFETEKSIPYLEKAVTNINPQYNEGSYSETKAEPEAFYYLGYAYHLCYRFEDAIQAYTKYKNQLDVKKLYYINKVDNQIAACHVCKTMIANPTNTHFTNLGSPINSNQTDFNPCVTANDSLLIYTRVKPQTSNEEGNDAQSVIWDNRIMSCHRNEEGNWTEPEDITSQLQTSGTFLTISLSPNGKTLYLFRDNYEDGGVKDNDRGALYVSHWRLGAWSPVHKMQLGINTLFNETHVSVSADGNLLCFTSDRTEGSFGGIDIYYCTKENDSVWSEPKNIGSAINTPFDEEAPSIVNDTILVFSSEGHNTMGGYDLFYSKRIASGWSEPINFRSPINTPADELFFIPVLGGRIAYHSAERRDVGTTQFGAHDIYMLDHFLDNAPAPVIAQIANKPLVQEQPIATVPVPAVEPVAAAPLAAVEPIPPVVADTPAPVAAVVETKKAAVELSVTDSVRSINLAPVVISGLITTSDGKPLDPVVNIIIRDAYTKQVVASLSPDYTTGAYSTTLAAGNYQIVVEGQSYTPSEQNLYVPANQSGSLSVSSKLVPKKVSSGKCFAVKAIFFDFNSAELTRDAKIELERLYVLMNENPSLKIEVVGHTDAKGSSDYNKALSLKRSQAVSDYLKQRGVELSQFVVKGVGEESSIAINENEDGSDNPAGRRLNRHVEIKILRSDNMNIVSENIPVPDHLAYKEYIRYSVQIARQSTELSAKELEVYASAALPKLEVLHVNNEYVYYAGDYRRKSDAMVLLNKVQGIGFASAEITDYFKTNRLTNIKSANTKQVDTTATVAASTSIVATQASPQVATPQAEVWYTLQLCALKKPSKKMRKDKKIKMYQCQDSLYRYAYNRYATIDEARADLQKVLDWGFKDAFVANGRRYTKLECQCLK